MIGQTRIGSDPSFGLKIREEARIDERLSPKPSVDYLRRTVLIIVEKPSVGLKIHQPARGHGVDMEIVDNRRVTY